MGKANVRRTQVDNLKDLVINKTKIYGLLRKQVVGAVSITGGAGGIGGNNSPASYTTSSSGTNLLNSNNVWKGTNTFDGNVTLEGDSILLGFNKISFGGVLQNDLNTNGSQIHGLRDPSSCGDAVTLCYLQRILSANGLTAGAITEALSESVSVGTNGFESGINVLPPLLTLSESVTVTAT